MVRFNDYNQHMEECLNQARFGFMFQPLLAQPHNVADGVQMARERIERMLGILQGGSNSLPISTPSPSTNAEAVGYQDQYADGHPAGHPDQQAESQVSPQPANFDQMVSGLLNNVFEPFVSGHGLFPPPMPGLSQSSSSESLPPLIPDDDTLMQSVQPQNTNMGPILSNLFSFVDQAVDGMFHQVPTTSNNNDEVINDATQGATQGVQGEETTNEPMDGYQFIPFYSSSVAFEVSRDMLDGTSAHYDDIPLRDVQYGGVPYEPLDIRREEREGADNIQSERLGNAIEEEEHDTTSVSNENIPLPNGNNTTSFLRRRLFTPRQSTIPSTMGLYVENQQQQRQQRRLVVPPLQIPSPQGSGQSGLSLQALVRYPGQYQPLDDYELNLMLANIVGKVERGIGDIDKVSRVLDDTEVSQHSEDICTICRENLKEQYDAGNSIRKTLCNHVYCHGCISPWLEKHLTCPLCSVDLEDFSAQNAQVAQVASASNL
jgi:Ring finger domain